MGIWARFRAIDVVMEGSVMKVERTGAQESCNAGTALEGAFLNEPVRTEYALASNWIYRRERGT